MPKGKKKVPDPKFANLATGTLSIQRFLKSRSLLFQTLQDLDDVLWLGAIVKHFSPFGVANDTRFVDHKCRGSIAEFGVNSHLKRGTVSDAGRERWIH